MARSNGLATAEVNEPRENKRQRLYGVAAIFAGFLLLLLYFVLPWPSIPRFKPVDISLTKPATKESCLAAVESAKRSHDEQVKNIDQAFQSSEKFLAIFGLPFLLLSFTAIATGLNIVVRPMYRGVLPRKSLIRSVKVGLVLGTTAFAFFYAINANYREVFRVSNNFEGKHWNTTDSEYCAEQFK